MTHINGENTCHGKASHHTRGAAESELRRLTAAHHNRGVAPGRLHAYRCVRCHTWHVGHMPVSARPQTNHPNRRVA